MKIIKYGKVTEDNDYRIHCKKCGTIFECKQDEFHDELEGFGLCILTVHCPVCGFGCNSVLEPDYCTIKNIKYRRL